MLRNKLHKIHSLASCIFLWYIAVSRMRSESGTLTTDIKVFFEGEGGTVLGSKLCLLPNVQSGPSL